MCVTRCNYIPTYLRNVSTCDLSYIFLVSFGSSDAYEFPGFYYFYFFVGD